MLLSSSVLIPPANAWPCRARSTGGNAHDRARSTCCTGPAVAVPPPASSAWIERENTWKSGRMGGRWGRPKADSDAGGAATWLTIILSCCVASCKSRMKIRHAYFCTLKSLNDCDDWDKSSSECSPVKDHHHLQYEVCPGLLSAVQHFCPVNSHVIFRRNGELYRSWYEVYLRRRSADWIFSSSSGGLRTKMYQKTLNALSLLSKKYLDYTWMLHRFFSFAPASAKLATLAPASEDSSSELSEDSACWVLLCVSVRCTTGLLVADLVILAFEEFLPVGGLKLVEWRVCLSLLVTAAAAVTAPSRPSPDDVVDLRDSLSSLASLLLLDLSCFAFFPVLPLSDLSLRELIVDTGPITFTKHFYQFNSRVYSLKCKSSKVRPKYLWQ